jgi:SH3-like domain-containing protein
LAVVAVKNFNASPPDRDQLMKKLFAATMIGVFLLSGTLALAETKGPVTGFPLPRFVSLKFNKAKMRVGPNKEYAVQWVYVRQGLPVEITQEFDQWMRIRDSEGTEGWMLHSLLSGKRTAIVTPWDKGLDPKQVEKFINLYKSTSAKAVVLAKLQPGVIVKVKECDKKWCEVTAGDISGHIQQPQLWGAYP